jgi:uncharacterized membrane protein YfcA
MTIDWFILAPAAFFAGMVDAVVGGGGLIQIPVLLSAIIRKVAIPTLFGTNKVSSIAGTGASLWRYARAVSHSLGRLVLPPPPPPCSAPGVARPWSPGCRAKRCVRWCVVMMLAVAIYTFLRKNFGHAETREPRPADLWRGALFGLVIGFYDGFFGPGTGSFLIFGFVRLFGMDFVRASASAKVINFATNVSAIGFFASHGPILWEVGLTMAACNLAGAWVGTHLALKHGAGFIRKAFLGVVTVLIIKQLLELF